MTVSTFTFKECHNSSGLICDDWLPTKTSTATSTTTATGTTGLNHNDLDIIQPQQEYSEDSPVDFVEKIIIFNIAKTCVGSEKTSSGFCFSENTGSIKPSYLSGEEKGASNEDASIPIIDFSLGEEFTGGIFAAYYKALDSMDKQISKESSFEVTSHVVALQIGDSICGYKICSSYEIDEGEIKMVFPQFKSRLDGQIKCSYWNMSHEQWATDGVSMVERNDTHITCTTTHLTNFATVHYMYPGNGRVSSKGLEITSNIVCGTSIIALMLVIYAMIRKIRDIKGAPTIGSRRSDQPILITHLSIALIMKMTSIMTLSIFDETTVTSTNDYIDYKCTTDGIILATMVQFTQLASICWMSCQAIDHYVKITRVAEGILKYPRSFMNRLVLLGWGIPSVTILLILILYYNEVEVFVDLSLTAVERICWVNTETLNICWVIPFASFFILNVYIFGKVMSTIIQIRRTSNGLKKSDNSRLRRALQIRDQTRVAFGLVVLFGISYFLAPFMYAGSDKKEGSYYQLIVTYSFLIINGLQERG